MKIDHIAIYVLNLERARDFYVKYFGAKSNDGYHNPNTGLKTYFLTFEDGARLEIMTRPETAPREMPPYAVGYAHIAFAVGDNSAVDILTERLRADGYVVTSAPRTTGDGYYESCVADPEGNYVEIVAG